VPLAEFTHPSYAALDRSLFGEPKRGLKNYFFNNAF
jgi:hypothetical protein